MKELIAQQKFIVKQMKVLCDKGEPISNTDLLEICRNFGMDLFSQRKETHLIHELFETALNQQIYSKFQGLNLENQKLHLQILNELIDLLKKCPPQSWRGEEQIKLQQFSTPPTIAFLMAIILNPKKTELILEPSAGTGSLAIWLKIAGCRFHLNELSEMRQFLLGLQGFASTACNAEFLDDLLPEEILPDAILMNPPFSANAGRTKSGDSNFGFRHITSALERLKSGGRLVALFSTDALMKTHKGLKFLSDLSVNFDLKTVIHLPKNAYYKYGTSLPVSIICIVKREPQKPFNEVLKINCPNLEDILSNAKIFD